AHPLVRAVAAEVAPQRSTLRFDLHQLDQGRGVQIQAHRSCSRCRASCSEAASPKSAGSSARRSESSSGGTTRPDASSWFHGSAGTGTSRATGRPRSVTSKPSPAATRAPLSPGEIDEFVALLREDHYPA